MPAGLARLAPVVEALAAAGDPQASALLRSHAEALADSVAGVAAALALEAPPVAALGGAISHLPTFRLLFDRAVAERLPRSSRVLPAGDAASGALALARQQLPAGPVR
jgi:N-acetylglucosamine kinase-like BadF-type ATPase